MQMGSNDLDCQEGIIFKRRNVSWKVSLIHAKIIPSCVTF